MRKRCSRWSPSTTVDLELTPFCCFPCRMANPAPAAPLGWFASRNSLLWSLQKLSPSAFGLSDLAADLDRKFRPLLSTFYGPVLSVICVNRPETPSSPFILDFVLPADIWEL